MTASLSVRLSVCCSSGCRSKTKRSEANKANCIQRVHLHALFFFLPLSTVTNLALSSTKLHSCQCCSYGRWHPTVSLYFSDSQPMTAVLKCC